jgi:hypothetical protein
VGTLRDRATLHGRLSAYWHAIDKMRGTYLFIDVLQRPIRVLAVADPMAAHASLTGVLLSFNQHVETGLLVLRGS